MVKRKHIPVVLTVAAVGVGVGIGVWLMRERIQKLAREARATSRRIADPLGLESALDRALGLWRNEPALFRQLVLQGMACDYSWNHPGQRYLDVYEFIRHK